VSGQVRSYPRRLPPLYRLARGLRRASVLVLVLLILFTASVVYSTSEVTRSPPQVGSFSVAFGSNGTMILAGSLTLSNPGFYPVDGFTLVAHVTNTSGHPLGSFVLGPETLASAATDEYPVDLYLPISATGAGASLLVDSQYLQIALWGNATFGYIFPAGITINETKAWEAPFSHLNLTAGTPAPNGSVPVTVSFQNDASLTEVGTLRVSVVAATGIICGTTSWTIDVGQGQQFDQTQAVTLSPGCSPAGGTVTGEYITTGYTVPLPSEAIP
jgi:hypothetical protein